MKHDNGLTHAEAERLMRMINDLSDVQKTIGDILVSGYDCASRNGLLPHRNLLTQKIANLSCSIGLLIGSNDISNELINDYMDKQRKVVNDFIIRNNDTAEDLVHAAEDKEIKRNLGANVFSFLGRKKHE